MMVWLCGTRISGQCDICCGGECRQRRHIKRMKEKDENTNNDNGYYLSFSLIISYWIAKLRSDFVFAIFSPLLFFFCGFVVFFSR